MRKFQILRYLKKLRYFIILVALIGSIGVYWYATKQQSYTAEAVIKYTNEGAAEGRTPTGTLIDPDEIYSATIITDVIKDLGLNVTIDNIRSACSVSEVISEDEQTRKEALLAEGEEYVTTPTTYKVTFKADHTRSKGYARNMLDSILSNYFTFYGEKYIDQAAVPNNVYNVSVEKYDYLDCVEMLDKSTKEIESYLDAKANLQPSFRSAKTGYSFGDLKDNYNYIHENVLPSYFALVIDNRLTSDKDALVKRYTNRISNYEIEIDSLDKQIKELTDLATQYGDKITSAGGSVAGAIGDNSDAIIEDVELWQKMQSGINVDTTYDDLIRHLVQLQSERSTKQVEMEDCKKFLDIFNKSDVVNTADNSTIQALSKDIDKTVTELNDLYGKVVDTVDEFNEHNGAKNVSTLTSTYVQEGININLYLEMAVVLFLILGCAGAIVLGRLGDFVDYFMYTDRKTTLPNRSKCDLVIESYSKGPLPDHFACIATRLRIPNDLGSKDGRKKGDMSLKDFAAILKNVSADYGFTGYNNGELFLSFFENCTKAKAEEFMEQFKIDVVSAAAESGSEIFQYTQGFAESTTDETYDIRKLMRFAFERLNGPSEGK